MPLIPPTRVHEVASIFGIVGTSATIRPAGIKVAHRQHVLLAQGNDIRVVFSIALVNIAPLKPEAEFIGTEFDEFPSGCKSVCTGIQDLLLALFELPLHTVMLKNINGDYRSGGVRLQRFTAFQPLALNGDNPLSGVIFSIRCGKAWGRRILGSPSVPCLRVFGRD